MHCTKYVQYTKQKYHRIFNFLEFTMGTPMHVANGLATTQPKTYIPRRHTVLYTEQAYFVLQRFYSINQTKNYTTQDIQARELHNRQTNKLNQSTLHSKNSPFLSQFLV